VDLSDFAADVGGVDAGPVTVVGGRTQWHVGGPLLPGAREVRAPVGVVLHEPAELIVRVGAGTPVAEVDAALRAHGQFVPLPSAPGATAGGVLAVGHGPITRLGDGPMRDTLLEARFVNAAGKLVKAGGPVVKNVSGFDLCRLLVGSLGTLGFLGEVVLRCRPRPAATQWVAADGADPFAVLGALFRPAAVLWDGVTVWVCLTGAAADVRDQRAALQPLGRWPDAEAPVIPAGWHRHSLRPSALAQCRGTFVAEIGVGVVHRPEAPARPARSEAVGVIHRRLKDSFDPTGRLNPGRTV
jgi:glycolate oxidase FAD binding subunit